MDLFGLSPLGSAGTPLTLTQTTVAMPQLGQASCRCSAATAAPALESSGLAPLASSQQMMGNLLLAMQLLLSGLMLGNPNAAAALSAGSGTALSAPVESGGGAAPVSSSAAGGGVAQQNSPPAGGKIGQGSKVLVIGDSHTAGTFGDELDKQLRARGAQVHTVGSSGATADNYISGKGTTVGYADHKVDGSTEKTASHATPKLEELIAQDKPDTIMVNLGANFRGAGSGQMQQQVSKIGDIAKRHNIRVIWVGPPTTREDQGNPGSLQKFDQAMAAAVAPYGEYISSAPFTPKYAGNDGVHYSGSEGSQLARQWAQGVAGKV